jgi:hypothetical protein
MQQYCKASALSEKAIHAHNHSKKTARLVALVKRSGVMRLNCVQPTAAASNKKQHFQQGARLEKGCYMHALAISWGRTSKPQHLGK